MADVRAQGPTLGRYHLAEALGGGPTGEVFRAKVFGVAGFERLFAVKRFYRALSDDPERMRLLGDAARKYQTIEHPRIARLHEFGVVEGQAFAAVELVPGVDLARLIAFTHGLGNPLPAGAALGVMAQIARAVAYAQGRGVLHLGIAPSNVIATADGDVKVLDFGLLKARLPQRPAADATLAARLPYLAPEQIEGAPVSPATDVFQLASLAHELITGRQAFGGGTPDEVATRVRSGQVAPELLPPGIGDVLARAFQVRPEDRYLNAGAFADALEVAIRKAPQVGGRSDVGSAVRRAQQRTSEMEAQQFSGAMAFPMAMPPPGDVAPVVPLSPQTIDSAPTRIDDRPGAAFAAQSGVIASSPRTPSASMPLPPPEPTLPGGDTPSVPGLPSMAAMEEELEIETGIRPTPSPSKPPPIPPAAFADPGGAAPPLPPPPLSTSSAGPAGPPLQPASLSGTELLAAMNTPVPNAPRARGGGGWKFAMILGGIALIGGGGYLAFQKFVAAGPSEPTAKVRGAGSGGGGAPAGKKPKKPKADAGAVAMAGGDADAGAGAGVVAAAVDAGVAVAVKEGPPDAAPALAVAGPADAGVAAVRPPVVEGVLRFESDPPGALVYFDGAKKGVTPLEMPASGDRHKVAIIKLGHAMYRADVDGKGLVKATLTPVTPTTGDGRIKVRCKTQGRLYVSVNGAPTGEICPTERIYTPLGKITVETYDPVTDSAKAHEVIVKPSKGSQRVRLDD